MTGGIIIFGANGSGKSTFGLALARVLEFKYMDIEAYYFEESDIPYTVERSREDCLELMLADIEKHGTFVLSSVTGDFGKEISSRYDLAVLITAPLKIRLARVEHREYKRHKERIHKGGDMYAQHMQFVDFVATRSLKKIEQWAETLECPLLQIDGTKDILDNVNFVVEEYRLYASVKQRLCK